MEDISPFCAHWYPSFGLPMMSGFQIKGGSLHLRALSLLFSTREFTFHYYLPPTKLREGNVFTRVYMSIILFRWLLKYVRSASGWYASYWNDFLFSNESHNPCFCVNYDTTKGIVAQNKKPKFIETASNISWSGSCPNTSFMVKADWSFLHLHSCGCCQCGSFYETPVSWLMDKISGLHLRFLTPGSLRII